MTLRYYHASACSVWKNGCDCLLGASTLVKSQHLNSIIIFGISSKIHCPKGWVVTTRACNRLKDFYPEKKKHQIPLEPGWTTLENESVTKGWKQSSKTGDWRENGCKMMINDASSQYLIHAFRFPNPLTNVRWLLIQLPEWTWLEQWTVENWFF